MYDESVTDLERFEKNIHSHNFLQKVSVYVKLDVVFRDNEMKKKILPIIFQQLPQDSKEMQRQAAEGFKKGLRLTEPEFPILMDILDLCLHIFEQWNIEVIEDWLGIFETLVQKISWKHIHEKIEEITKMLSLASQPVQSRYAAVKVISTLAKVKGHLIEGVIFDRCIHLIADYEKDIRLALAEDAILDTYAAVKSPVYKNIMFEKVFELAYDPDQEVKIATIKLVVKLLDILDEQRKREKIALLFSEIAGNVNDKVIFAMSECLSQIIVKVSFLLIEVR